MPRGSLPEDWLTTVLATSGAVALIGNVLGTANYDVAMRLPLFIIMGVVLARNVGSEISVWIPDRRTVATVIGVLLILLYAGPAGHFLRHGNLYEDSASPLGQWLMAHRLTYGYGDYSSATMVTLETRGAVQIRAVVSTKVAQPGLGPSGAPSAQWRLRPYNWMSKDTWYQHPARFLVVNPNAGYDRDLGLTKDTAVRTFGQPDHVYENVDSFTVLVWDRPMHF